MSMITKIAATDFKGTSFQHDLGRVTLFHGQNFTNKSSRVEALTLALLGYLPGVGAKPSDLHMRLASARTMAVAAVVDGRAVSRQWQRKGESVSYTGTGDDVEWPAHALDIAGEFLSLSGPERVKFLFRAAKLPEDLTVEKVRDKVVSNIKAIKGEDNAEEVEAAIRSLVGTVDALDDFGDTQQWLELLSAKLGENKKAAVATVQRLQKTLQGMTQADGSGGEPPPDAEERLHRAQAALDASVRALADIEAEGKAAVVPAKDERLEALRAARDSAVANHSILEDELEAFDEPSPKSACPQCGDPACACWAGVVKSAIKKAKARRKELEAEVKKAAAARDAAQKELDGYKAPQQDTKRADELRERWRQASQARAQREDERRAAQQDYDRLVAQRATVKLRTEVTVQLRTAEAQEVVAKAAQKMVDELLATAVSRVVGGVLDMANRLCAGLLKFMLSYNPDQRDFGLMDVRGWFWSHRSWSGTEKALGYAALSVALAQKAPVRLVVLDELGRLDPHRKRELVGTLCRLCREGHLDQAVLVDVAPIAFTDPDLVQIECDGR